MYMYIFFTNGCATKRRKCENKHLQFKYTNFICLQPVDSVVQQ